MIGSTQTLANPPAFCDLLIGVHSWVIGIVVLYVLVILLIPKISSGGYQPPSEETQTVWSLLTALLIKVFPKFPR